MRNFKETLTKLLALSLVLLMLLPMAMACKKDEQSAGGDTSAEAGTSDVVTTEPPVITDEWGQEVQDHNIGEEVDFGGKAITILVRDGEQYMREWTKNAEEEKDALDQEIYYRNIATEEYLGVKLDYRIVKNSDADTGAAITTLVKNSGMAGAGEVDIVNNFAAYATNTTVMQFYKDWFSQDLNYLHLNHKYWHQDFINDAQAHGRLFVCVGDVNLSVYDRSIVTFFNKKLVQDVYKDQIGDIYKTALDGEWTYDLFYEYTKNFHEDGGTLEDETDDIYGVATIAWSEAADGFLYSWDLQMTQQNDDSTHTVVTGTAREKLVEAFGKMADFWYSDGAITLTGSGNNTAFFVAGRALFDVDVIYHYASHKAALMEMPDGFGIIPLPKYDEDQDYYLTGVQDAHNVMSIMNNGMNGDYAAVSAVLEYMCATNYSSVRPFYIEKMLKGQFLTDANSVKCLELVLDNPRWDFADIYNTFTGSVRNAIWRGPLGNYNAGDDITTRLASREGSLNESLAKLDAWLVTNY